MGTTRLDNLLIIGKRFDDRRGLGFIDKFLLLLVPRLYLSNSTNPLLPVHVKKRKFNLREVEKGENK